MITRFTTATSTTTVILEEVSKFILSRVSLHIPKGECVGIIGASGAGKTTLLKLVCGLLLPTKGYVRTLGKEPVAQKGRYGRRLSAFFVGRSPLEGADTVRQSLALLQSIYGLPKEEFWQEYAELAERLDFAKYENEPLKKLSLGQRMRVELAAVLIGSPELIVLDEPNVGLDENGKVILWELLQEHCQRGATVLVASHNLTELSQVCSRLVLLEGGRLLYYGTESNLRSRYASIDRMELKLAGKLPDLEDLPLKEYRICGDSLRLSYDSNHLSAAEILGVILRQTRVKEIKVTKPTLEDIILQLGESSRKGGSKIELD